MKRFNLSILLIITLFFSSCSSLKDGFTSQKKNNSDEFLVEKKSPLVMPPDYNELPIPQQENLSGKNNEYEIKKLITKNKSGKIKNSNSAINGNIENSILEKIKDN